jgi:hypothetical protein
MRKIDYSKIKWNATTNWEFCGSYDNLREVWERHWEYIGLRVPIEEFGYNRPRKGLAFKKGDVVTYTEGDRSMFAVVEDPVSSTGYFYVRVSDGSRVVVHPSHIGSRVLVADIPGELMALARAEVGKPLDLSKCPLKKAGACMKGDEE